MISEEQIDAARDCIAYGAPEAVGYRLMVKPIYSETKMAQSEMDKYETLSNRGFQSKTKEQAEKESRGTHHGILIHKGAQAYKGELAKNDAKPWVEVGDVLIFDRYAGVEMEIPPGSGDIYKFINDESVLGRMVKNG